MKAPAYAVAYAFTSPNTLLACKTGTPLRAYAVPDTDVLAATSRKDSGYEEITCR
jgi:hypothetical protein